MENVHTDNLEKLTAWWFQKSEGRSRVSSDSEGLNLLDAVIGHSAALSAFEKGATIYEAYELISDIDLLFEKKIKNSLKFIEQADALSNRIKSFYRELYEDLKNIRKIAAKINDYKTKISLE